MEIKLEAKVLIDNVLVESQEMTVSDSACNCLYRTAANGAQNMCSHIVAYLLEEGRKQSD